MLWGIFSAIQTIYAQIPWGFIVTNTQHTGNYITTGNYWTINVSWSDLISLFQRSWNWITTNLYDPNWNTIYFDNFDTPEILEQNQVPLADSIRDFPDENFTWWTIGTGKNGWSYLYKYDSQKQIQQYCDSTQEHICVSCDPWTFTPYCNNTFLTWFTSSIDETSPIQECEFGYTVCEECDWSLWDCISPYDPQVRNFFPKAYADVPIGWFVWYSCITYWPWEEAACESRILQAGISLYNKLIYNSLTNLRTIWADQIINHNFANIGKKYAHPGSGTTTSLPELSWLNNIPVIRQRTSSLSGRINIISTIKDDDNNCGNGIIYKIYTGVIEDWGTLTGIKSLKTYYLPNLSGTTIQRSGNITTGQNIFFEIDNSWDNQCDGTRNRIQIYNITNTSWATGWPSYVTTGKYWWALEFSWTQLFSLGTGINQWANGITIAARVNTRDNSKSQGIITKKFSYGIVVKQGTLRIAPSTYWMWHDTGIPVNNNERTHIAWTYNGATMRAYKNGSQIRTYNINGTLSGNENLAMIGYDELNNRWRDGYIDEFRMYDTAFSTGQIKELYESNLQIINSGSNSSWNFINSKTGLVDGIYNYEIWIWISNITWSITVDQHWPILTERTGFTVYESQRLVFTGIRYDTGINWNATTWFDRWEWRDINWDWNIMINGENSMDFWIENEPIIKQIKIRVKDFVGNESYWTGIIQRVNTWPIITDTKNIYTGIVEDKITFIASWYDIEWEPLSYKWYSWWNCIFSWLIQWETNQTYTTGRETADEIQISYKISDKQNIGSCWNITAQRENPNEENILPSNNSWIPLWWWNTAQTGITGTIVYPWWLWTCTWDNEYTYYIGTWIGNDYCIIENGSGQIVLWWYGVNKYLTLFSQTGTRINPYLINENIQPFVIEFQNTNLTEFTRSLSGINNDRTTNNSIYNSWLIGLYNFDKILLTDSEKDFSAIQSGKNRSYWRRPKGTGTYELLQYYAPSQQRIISTPIEDFDGLFIEKNELNPGYNYWDTVLWRTSPINATIEINYTLTDANTSCGDWIQYKLLKNDTTTILATGTFEAKIITTQIFSWETIYLVVNGVNNNDCDNTNYNIKIYQLPESNLWTKGNYQWINSWALYTTWKYNWGVSFSENNYITIGTGIQSNKMSISARVYKWAWSNQTLIQKRWSYGIVIYNNKLQVTNQNTIRRYDTQIVIPEETRTHIGRSYDWTNMKVYINGKEQRSWIVVGTIPSNNYPIHIGYSFSNGLRDGIIDEIYIYNYAIDSNTFASLYNHNLNRIARDRRQRTSNQSWWIYDGKYYFQTKVNNVITNTGEIIRDFSAPLFTGFIWLTGQESNPLTITGFWYDSGYYISWYQWRYSIDWFVSERSNRSTGNTFTIPKQEEPITGTLEIKIKDFFWYETTTGIIIEWINTWPIIIGNTDFYGKVGQNIAFLASWYDTNWWPLTYQRYHWRDCSETQIIAWKTGSILITWNTNIETVSFSYKIFDKQGSGSCSNISWTRSEDTIFINYTEYFIWDGNGGIISWAISSLWKKIIENAQYGKCTLTGNNLEIINYNPNTWSRQNDSCIIELMNSTYIVAAFTGINSWFTYTRTSEIPQIITNKRNILRKAIMQIPTISWLTGSWIGTTTQWSGIKENIIKLQTNNLIRKYSFDKVEITNSATDFWYFSKEHGRNYLWNNGSTWGELSFNPRTKSRIINEPLQDYEYVFINSWFAYPGSIKYGDIIYERTSTVTGNIDIETNINNANAGSCTSSDGIIYTIKKWASQIYTKEYLDTRNIDNDFITTGTTIASWDKLSFIIHAKENNQCDKIAINIKIYQNTTNDYSSSAINFTKHWAYEDAGKFNGGITFWSTTEQYINIWTINQKTGLSFSTWMQTNAISNQTIIYKEWSYGLTIKDNQVKVTTDGGRWYPTNTTTFNKIVDGNRHHVVRTYNWTTMSIYIDTEQTRSGRINGYYPINSNPTILWRDGNHGQFNGSLDELSIWNTTLTKQDIENLYYTQIIKTGKENRELSLVQTGLQDGIHIFTGYINETYIFTGKVIIDLDWPIIELTTKTTWEGSGLSTTISWYDNGTAISWYQWRRKIGNGNRTTYTDRTGNNIIDIWAQNEPITGTLEIKVKDISNNEKVVVEQITRENTAITTYPLYKTGYEWANITFIASWSDRGGTTNTGYQRFSWNTCSEIITGATGANFTIKFNEPGERTFSYIMKDAQGISSLCTTSTTTGIRENTIPTANDIIINANGNTGITFTISWSDPGGTVFSAKRYNGSECLGTPLETNTSFTTGSYKSGSRIFSYYLRDAQGATGTNTNNFSRTCQIATGYRPHINPIAHDFIINENTRNTTSTADRKDSSDVRDSELETTTTITASISSWSKGYCQISNDWISFYPNQNQIGTWVCEIRLTDTNNGITYIKAYALNIDTTPPQTTISGTNESIKLIYNDTSTGTTYYKVLTGVRAATSCWNSGYTMYVSWTMVSIPYAEGINDNKTLCYYSEDTHGNKETIKADLFNQDTARLQGSFSANTYMKNEFQAIVSVSKACHWILTWLDEDKSLSFPSAGTYILTGSFQETQGQKTVSLFLETDDPWEWTLNYTHTFTIDTINPSNPIITEVLQYNDYYSIRRSSAWDQGAGILWYRYQVNNEASTLIKSGFTEVTYLNIFKSEVQNNSSIAIKVQAEDKVNNYSARSTPTTITITPQTTSVDTTPNSFSFNKVTNAKRNNEYTSNEIVIGWLSANTTIPITTSTWTLFINNTKLSTNSGTVKNGDIVYIKLKSSENYNEKTQATINANNIIATYTITTESKSSSSSSSTSSFLDELKKLLEQLKEDDTKSSSSTGIDTKWLSAPYIAPNGKTYNLFKTLDGKYSAQNFIYKKYFNSLTELKQYIDKNNPRK